MVGDITWMLKDIFKDNNILIFATTGFFHNKYDCFLFHNSEKGRVGDITKMCYF